MQIVVIRLGLVGFASLMAFTAWMLWIRDNPELRVGEAIEWLYVIDQEALTSVAITSNGNSVRFNRGPSEWQFERPKGIGVNTDRWGGIVLLLSGPQIERALGSVNDLREFGLDAPSIIELTLDDGTRIVVALGDRTPDDRHHYVNLLDSSTVFLINADWGRVLKSLAEEPPYPYWYYRVNPEQARVFEIDEGNRKTTMFLGTNPDLPDTGRVLIDMDNARDLTTAEFAKALSLVGGPSSIQVIDQQNTNTSVLGLVDPSVTLRVTYQLKKPIDGRVDFSTIYVVGTLTADVQSYFVTTSDAPSLLTFDAAWIDALLGFSDSLR